MMPTSFSQIIEGVLNAIVSILAAYLLVQPFATGSVKRATYGAVGSTLGTAAGVIVGLLFMGFVYFSYKPTIDKRVRHDRHKAVEDYKTLFKVIVMTVTPVILSSCIYNICPVIDQTLFATILESQKIHDQDISVLQGIYSAKYLKLVSVPASIASALSSAIIPAITANMVENDLEAANDKIDRAMKVTMLIAVPSMVGLIVLARPIMLLFGRSTTLVVAVHVLMWGAICVVFNCISTLSNAILQGLNNMRAPMIHSLIALALHIAACVYFLKRGYGIYALIIATMVFAVVIWILNAIVIYRITGYRKPFGNGIVRIVVASVLMGVCTFTFYQVCMLLYGKEGMELLFLLLSLAVALVSYLLFLYVVNAFTEEDYDYLPMGARIRSLGVRLRLVETASQPFEEEMAELYEEEETPKKKFIFRKQEAVEDDMDDLMEDTLGMTADDFMSDAMEHDTKDMPDTAPFSEQTLDSQDAAVQSLLSSLKKESESIQEESVRNIVDGENPADRSGDIEIMDISQLLNEAEEVSPHEMESDSAGDVSDSKTTESTLDLIDADSILSKYHKQAQEASSQLQEALKQHRQE
jgi:stage V sporulation protein B